MIYIYNSLSILLIGIIFSKKLEKPKNKKIYLFFCFLQMVLIQGLRADTVGRDTIMYVNTYKYYKTSELYAFQLTHFEIGFKIFYNLMSFLNFDSQMMLLTVSSLTMFFFGYFIYKNSQNVYISTFIFACMLYPNSFNIMRQYLALSIAVNSYQFIVKEKYKTAFLIIIGAMFFHLTAILMFIPLIMKCLKKWNLLRCFLVLFALVCLVFEENIVTTLLNILGKNFYTTGYEVNRIFRMTTALTIFLAVLIWYFKCIATELKDKQDLNLLTNIAFFNMCMGIIYLRYEFFSRVIELLNVFLLVSIPLGLKQIKTYYKSIWRWASYCIPFLLMLNAVYNSNSGIENYKLFFM